MTVNSHMTMSLDGYIAHPDDTIDGLFDWYEAGTIDVPTTNDDIAFKLSEADAETLGSMIGRTGVLVCGRRLFDITQGWGDAHPIGTPVVVVTHHRPDDADRWRTIEFADDVESGIARAREIAQEKDVTISSADIARQALELGLLEEIHVSLAPILLGRGIPYFAELSRSFSLDDPTVIPGTRVTHLRYRVRR